MHKYKDKEKYQKPESSQWHEFPTNIVVLLIELFLTFCASSAPLFFCDTIFECRKKR